MSPLECIASIRELTRAYRLLLGWIGIAMGRRWANGESIAVLARELGMSWNRLWIKLTKLDYRKET